MGRPLIPVAGGMAILGAASMLIVGITLRPWASADTSWRTELNLTHDAPAEDYTRSIPTLLDTEASLESWRSHDDPGAHEAVEGSRLFVGLGCASCHVLSGEGGVVGDALYDLSPSDLRKALKKGKGGMPGFLSLDDADVDELLAVLTGRKAPVASEPEGVQTPSASPGPGPSPTPEPAPASVVVPSPAFAPAPTGKPAPGATQIPQASATPPRCCGPCGRAIAIA